MNEQCKDGHTILGLSCTVCGWNMKLLNLYVPEGKVISDSFESELREYLPEGTRIVLVEAAEVPTLNEVGFSLPMHDKLYLTTQFVDGLRDA